MTYEYDLIMYGAAVRAILTEGSRCGLRSKHPTIYVRHSFVVQDSWGVGYTLDVDDTKIPKRD